MDFKNLYAVEALINDPEREGRSLPLLTVNPLIHLHQFHSVLLEKEFCCLFYNIWQCTSIEWYIVESDVEMVLNPT